MSRRQPPSHTAPTKLDAGAIPLLSIFCSHILLTSFSPLSVSQSAFVNTVASGAARAAATALKVLFALSSQVQKDLSARLI
jgi:hypothetical protein